MPLVGTSSTGGFACATATQRTLRDLQTKRRGQPVFVAGHIHERLGQEATFELFNVRLAVVKFSDEEVIGFDPSELLLPTEIDEKGVPFFEIRRCRTCDGYFPLTKAEAEAEDEPTQCPECAT